MRGVVRRTKFTPVGRNGSRRHLVCKDKKPRPATGRSVIPDRQTSEQHRIERLTDCHQGTLQEAAPSRLSPTSESNCAKNP